MTTTQPAGSVVDGDIVEDIAPDKPTPTPPENSGGRERRRRDDLPPLVPPWLRSASGLIKKVDDALYYPVLKLLGYLTPWRGLPHVLTVLKYAPRGAWRDLVWVVAWMRHWETKEMKQAYAAAGNPEWNKVHDRIQKPLRARRGIVLGAAVMVPLVLWLQWWLTSDWHPQVPWLVWWWPSSPVQWPWLLRLPWPSWLMLAGAIVWWGYRGHPVGEPWFKPATGTVSRGVEDLTDNLVIQALGKLGISGMKTPEELAAIELLYGVKPTRAGYNIDLRLPRGVVAEQVMTARKTLAGNLGRNIGSVWPMQGPNSPAHLQLFVGHKDMSKADQKPWPLLKRGSVDLFKPVPMFTDQQGDWVELTLANLHGVVGAITGMGKTHFLRELALIAGLDVRAEVYVFDLKADGGLRCAKLFAHYYSDSVEEEDIAEHLGVLEGLVKERKRRAGVLKTLPDTMIPDGEVTSVLASDPTRKLHPILVIIDEADIWTCHATLAGAFKAAIEDLVRRGRAAGITVYLASQTINKETIPPVISQQAQVRVCFTVTRHHETDQILGSGANTSGMRPHLFDPADVGIAWVKAPGVRQVGRTVGALNKIESNKVAQRAYTLREEAGRLTGMAADEEIAIESREVQLIDAIIEVFGSAKAMHLGDIAAGLAARHPGMYGSLNAEGLGKLLRAMTPAIEPGSVYVPDKTGNERTGKGLKREQLDVDVTSETIADRPGSNVRQLPLNR